MSYKSGSTFPAAFEFVVRKQDCLPLVKVTDYAYQALINSILGGPLFASPEPVIKQEEKSVLLPEETPTLVEEPINLVYPQFEELEEFTSYRSESLRLPPAPRFNTPVDQKRIEFFQGWEFEEGDIWYAPPPLEPLFPPQVWQEPLPISARFPPADLLDPGYHVPEIEQVHQDFRNFYTSPQSTLPPLEESVDWTYVRRHLLEQEIFRSGFSTPLTSDLVGIAYNPYRAFIPNPVEDLIQEGINLGIEQQGNRWHRSHSLEECVSQRRSISSELSSSSSTSPPPYSLSPPPIPRWHWGIPNHYNYHYPPLHRSEHLRLPAHYRQL